MYLPELSSSGRITTATILTFVLFFIMLHFFTGHNSCKLGSEKSPTPKNSELCLTHQCVVEAYYYISNMNETADPCEKFYEFACGKYIQKNTRLLNLLSWVSPWFIVQSAVNEEILEQVREKVKPSDTATYKKIKTYFQNCVNTTQIEKDGNGPILELMESFGGWPIVIGNSWNESTFDLKDSLQKVWKKNCWLSFPFDLRIIRESKNSSKFVLNVGQFALMHNRSFLTYGSKLPSAFIDLVKTTSVLLGADELTAHQDAVQIGLFESTMFRAQTLLDVPRHITVKELSSNITTIPWLFLFNMILNQSGIQVDENEVVSVPNMQFLTKLADLIDKTPKRTLANYLGWSILYQTYWYLPEKLSLLFTNFLNVKRAPIEKYHRERWCMKDVNSILRIGANSMYVKKYFNNQTKEKVQDIFVAIKDQMKKNLRGVDWMDEKTRGEALEKLEAMDAIIGHPAELIDDQMVDNYYSKLEVHPGNYLSSRLNISMFSWIRYYKSLRVVRDKFDWTTRSNSTRVNAFYLPQLNLVDVSAAILRGPFYLYERPQYLNFGAIGTFIGHEVTHAFDNVGQQYDKTGILKDWWQPDTKQKYTEKATCFIDQYNQFVMKENVTVNGTLTQNENIADNGGTRLAYHAYEVWEKNNGKEPALPGLDYTPQQMFWISAANNWCSAQKPEYYLQLMKIQSHSPDPARVIVTYSNIPEFARDFQCKVGSRMNPKKRCVVW